MTSRRSFLTVSAPRFFYHWPQKLQSCYYLSADSCVPWANQPLKVLGCSLACSWVATTTGTNELQATTLRRYLKAFNRTLMNSTSTSFIGIQIKSFFNFQSRWKLMTLHTGSSAGCSQFTQTTSLDSPGLPGSLPCHSTDHRVVSVNDSAMVLLSRENLDWFIMVLNRQLIWVNFVFWRP